MGEVNRLRVGETLHRDLIATAVKNVVRDAVTAIQLNTPLADIVPAANQIIRAELGQTTVS